MAAEEGQQHPIRLYVLIWILLFVFSAFSYATDFMDSGYLRWFLILLFMMLKAGFIVAIFMHLMWERYALIYALLLPPLALLVLVAMMAWESDYTWLTRIVFFGDEPYPDPCPPVTHGLPEGCEPPPGLEPPATTH